MFRDRTFTMLALLSLLGVSFGQRENCRNEDMMKCVDPLKVISEDKHLAFATTQQELDKVCPDLTNAFSCLEEYTTRCFDVFTKGVVEMPYEGAKKVIGQLCTDTPFRAEYLQHAPCINSSKTEFQQCVEEYIEVSQQLTSNTTSSPSEIQKLAKVQKLCCTFKKYSHCTTEAAREKCGDKAAAFIQKYIDQSSGSLIGVSCNEVHHDSPQCSSAFSLSSTGLLVALLSAIVVFLRQK